jgi:dihydrodipicolinate synthase/N-acetylneuraminate lyase
MNEKTKSLPKFAGVYPILYMPFNEKFDIDYEDLRKLTEFVVASGADGLGIAMGSEIFKMSESERDLVLKTVVNQVNGRVNVVMHTGSQGTDLTVKYSLRAKELGADALMVTPPTVIPLPSAIIVKHYVEISEKVKMPIFIQDIWTSPIPPPVMIEIVRATEYAKYAKAETPPTTMRTTELKKLGGDEVVVFGGAWGTNFIAELNRGSVGTMPGCAVPEFYTKAWKYWKMGRADDARIHMGEISPLLSLLTRSLDVSFHLDKEILKRRGVINSINVRMPTSKPDKITYWELDKLIESLDI